MTDISQTERLRQGLLIAKQGNDPIDIGGLFADSDECCTAAHRTPSHHRRLAQPKARTWYPSL